MGARVGRDPEDDGASDAGEGGGGGLGADTLATPSPAAPRGPTAGPVDEEEDDGVGDAGREVKQDGGDHLRLMVYLLSLCCCYRPFFIDKNNGLVNVIFSQWNQAMIPKKELPSVHQHWNFWRRFDLSWPAGVKFAKMSYINVFV